MESDCVMSIGGLAAVREIGGGGRNGRSGAGGGGGGDGG